MSVLDDDLVDQLQRLAAAAAPASRPRPDLADRVLRLAHGRRRRLRRRALTAGGLLTVGVVAAAALPGRGAYSREYQPSGSMGPTVRVGDQLLAGRHLRVQRGDLAVVRVHLDGADVDMIRRVAGLPGDRLACPDAGTGRCVALVVDGRPLVEPYLAGDAGTPFPPRSVPPGMLFVLGDDRDGAVDSRRFGPVPTGAVRGVGVRIIDAHGHRRLIPGAPGRSSPQGSDTTDPRGPVPRSRVAPAQP